MVNRFVWFWVAAIMGILLLICGYLVPSHVRAIDASVLKAAGSGTPSLVTRAMALIDQQKLGAAQLLLQVAQAERLSERASLGQAAGDLARQEPRLEFWGGPEPRLQTIANRRSANAGSEPFTDFVVRKEHRGRVLEFLAASKESAVAELLRCRNLTNTVIFPPSWTSAGQAFDAAISVTGMLLAENRLNPALSKSIYTMASAANSGANPHYLEQALLDLMSLGQRLNWGQMVVFVENIRDAETLRYLTTLIRNSESELPAFYSAVELSGDPAGVARYAMNFSNTGIRDLRAAIHFNEGGLRLLIERNKRLRHSPADNLLNNYVPFDSLPVLAWKVPAAALALKWGLYLAAGYLFALAMHILVRKSAAKHQVYSDQRSPRDRDRRRQLDLPPVRGFHVLRELLFALGFLLVVLLVSEPFLTLDIQKTEFPFHLRVPVAGIATAAGAAEAVKSNISSNMNQLSLLTLLLFFVIQALIYTACVFKLAEIRRQKVGPRMKLKLLDNEDHLFDAGLYLGFVGTIISLILVSLGVIKPSLMAAYSSTSFGIIFVSAFKIFNLRPVKRRLILEGEAQAPDSPDATRFQATT